VTELRGRGYVDVTERRVANPDYNLADVPFEDRLEALRELRHERHRRHAAAQSGKGVEGAARPDQPEYAHTLFDHAPFFKQYLLLHRLKQAVDECTEDDLRAVGRDLCVLREIGHLAGRVIQVMTSSLPGEFALPAERFLRSTPARRTGAIPLTLSEVIAL
jgi:hypothetical protein